MRAQESSKKSEEQNLVKEVLAEELDEFRTHKPEVSHDILNDLVIDRGPNPSKQPPSEPFHNQALYLVHAD